MNVFAYKSHIVRKPVYAICEQQRHRSACASAQSDQRASFWSCTGPFGEKEAAYKGLVRPLLDYGISVWDPQGVVLQEELESVQKGAAIFVTGNYNYETGNMTGILGQLKWKSLKKRWKDNRLIFLYKGLKVKSVYQQMTLSPKLGVVEISTLWHFRIPLLIQMFIKVASSPGLSGIGIPSPILWSHLLKMQRIVLLRSLLWWELGTNSLSTGPCEWLSFRRFTSKLSWSWVLSGRKPRRQVFSWQGSKCLSDATLTRWSWSWSSVLNLSSCVCNRQNN